MKAFWIKYTWLTCILSNWFLWAHFSFVQVSLGAVVGKLQPIYRKLRITKSPTNLTYDIFPYLLDILHAYEHRDTKMEQETSWTMQKYLGSWCKHIFSGCFHRMILPSKKTIYQQQLQKGPTKNFYKNDTVFSVHIVPDIWRKVKAEAQTGPKESYFFLVNMTLMQKYLHKQIKNTHKNTHLSIHLGSESKNKVQPKFCPYCKLVKVLVTLF